MGSLEDQVSRLSHGRACTCRIRRRLDAYQIVRGDATLTHGCLRKVAFDTDPAHRSQRGSSLSLADANNRVSAYT